MEKLDLQTFRNLKQEVIDMNSRENSLKAIGKEFSEEEKKKFIERYKEIIEVLSNHDLSDIEFEEWNGMVLSTENGTNIDFSNTNANIDFSIIDYIDLSDTFKDLPNFQSCKIKNFNFIENNYSSKMFDENYKSENEKYFLSENASDEAKEGYYLHKLKLSDFSNNLEYFKDKEIEQAFYKITRLGKNEKVKIYSDKATQNIIQLYGKDIYKLFEDYKPLMDKLINEGSHSVLENIKLPTTEISNIRKRDVLGEAILMFFRGTKFVDENIGSLQMLKMITDFVSLKDLPVSDSIKEKVRRYRFEELSKYGIENLTEISKKTTVLYKIKEIIDERPVDLINLGEATYKKISFIKKYGIDNIIKLDEETNGMFSHELYKDGENFLFLFAMGDKGFYSSSKELTYDEFKDKMYKILVNEKEKDGLLFKGNTVDYDFIQGDFRKEYSNIFINGDIDSEVKMKFYRGKMTAEDIRKNPELIQILKEKNLNNVFKKQIQVGVKFVRQDENGNRIGGIPNKVNMCEYISKKIGQEKFLEICADYGSCMDEMSLTTSGEIPVEDFRNVIEKAIYDGIKGIKEIKEIKYFDDLPLSFKEKYPELFLPDYIDDDIKDKFCKGELTFEDVRKSPELAEILENKDINIGFRKLKPELRKKLTKKETINFALQYGNYLLDVDDHIFEKDQSSEEKEMAICRCIEKNILNRYEIDNSINGKGKEKIIYENSLYNENVPEFFKQKYLNMFLDEDAPKKLKKMFYDHSRNLIYFVSIGGVNKAKQRLDFELIKKYPEWKKYLQGKELSRAFARKYKGLFERIDSPTLLKLGVQYPENIEIMVDEGKEEILEMWCKSTGGRFIPHYTIMQNFPTDEIDNFLLNSKKWQRLMSLDSQTQDDKGKVAVLKLAYAMGVFHGDDEGFTKTMEMLTKIPKELSIEEYSKIIEKISFIENDKEKQNLFEESYKWGDNGKWILIFNQLSKQKQNEKRRIRDILEKSNITRILTPEKTQKIFYDFEVKYDHEFAKFLSENIEEIISNQEYINNIARIQKCFEEILKINAGRKITLGVAQDYIREMPYINIDIGNEELAEKVKIAGYSQSDFNELQRLYNEGKTREYSSIPRIQGEVNEFTYEMLRCDDPLILTIGRLTDSCQKLNSVAETSMEHSMVSPDGRVFCVKDEQGRIVAQSWVWRNQDVICFDNIEIPKKIFEIYKKEHQGAGKKELISKILGVYKQASQDLMKVDEETYGQLLAEGTITRDQYEALLLGKVTVGLGFNDVEMAISKDKDMHRDSYIKNVKDTERIQKPYTDASVQYIIAKRDKNGKRCQKNIYVYQDDIPVYNGENITGTLILKMKRMENLMGKSRVSHIHIRDIEEGTKEYIVEIATEYGFESNNTRIMDTSQMEIIYSQEDDKIVIGDLFFIRPDPGLSIEKKQKAETQINLQIKKALKQLQKENKKIDYFSLDEEQKQVIQLILTEIEKENKSEIER